MKNTTTTRLNNGQWKHRARRMQQLPIWIITVGEPLPKFSPSDRPWRSGYLATLLATRGHDVTWWTSSFDHFRREHFRLSSDKVVVQRNLTIQFLHGRDYQRNVSFARQINHLQIARAFKRLASTYSQPAVIVCSFPPIELAGEAVRYGQTNGVPTFLDIRDLWPDEMVAKLPNVVQPFGHLVFAPLYSMTRRSVKNATGLLSISRQFLDWGLELAGRAKKPCDRIFPMGYTGSQSTSDVTAVTRDAVAASGVDPAKKILWFAGTFVGNMDVGTVIEAARRMQTRTEFQFVLTGAGERDPEWREQAEGLDNVVFTGWAGQTELAYLGSIAWAGLVAYHKGARMSFPNKFFQYMSAGLPVLLALEGETRDFVISNDIGVAYAPGEPTSLVAAIEKVANEHVRARFSENALRLFKHQFSARVIYEEYARFLEEAAESSRRGA